MAEPAIPVGQNVPAMRLVIAKCTVDYAGRLTAHLPLATRLIMVKADGSVSVHSDGGPTSRSVCSHKPLLGGRSGVVGSPFGGAWGGRVRTRSAKRSCWG